MHIPGVYKIDVPQGNIVTQEMVDQLHTGMSKRQVSYTMGTPLVVDVFHPERWDYIYSFQKGGRKPEQHHVTLHFENDQLTRIEGDYQPRPGAAGAVPSNETTVTVTPPPPRKGFISRLFGSKTEPAASTSGD
jgi:outer membrane protein assembly factor BamE